MSEPDRLTLVLRYADVGIATYGSLRVVGQPSKTVTWVVDEPILLAALQELADALPEPRGSENRRDAIERALTRGPFAAPDTELTVAYILGVLLIGAAGWQLLAECVASPRAALFVSPTARLARVPWAVLALPKSWPSPEDLVRLRAEAFTVSGTVAAPIPWQLTDVRDHTDGYRLMELVDVLMAVPQNIVHAPRTPALWHARQDGPPLLVLDPRVPGQLPDSPLGSVLGRPSEQTPLAQHFAELLDRGPVLPAVGAAVELFRRQDANRKWLAELLGQSARPPRRLIYVGHASSADGDPDQAGRADRAALHLACTAAIPGDADPVGEHRPLTASDLMSLRLPMPPRVALLACASGGDYQFDEATGLVAAMILGGAQLVTATLWSLPTTAAYRRFGATDGDPMADVVIAVDRAHEDVDAGCAVNRWQREQMRRWRDGDVTASPLYWAALVTFTVDGVR
ncbi:CHAT domain-containing protein [Mycobacterium sp. 1164966.3]|uniref:CHAT domain-containing protein n=1 Tax=Mycobacterium sp. 1164966.3 TaxID=1856861 RepID=UPI000801B31B|nr:CHAT domain-containing protein [Mycobacterium sp. 1164966.3]OBA82956.1 CHAT domain-containing protein [Mycobacterium sp. 1164966.3]